MSSNPQPTGFWNELKHYSKRLLSSIVDFFDFSGNGKTGDENREESQMSQDAPWGKDAPTRDEKRSVENLLSPMQTQAVPDEKREVEPLESSTASAPPEEPKAPPATVWHGEEGPELAERYGVTVLQAMPLEPRWAYVYWDLADSLRDRLGRQEGEWIFDISTPILKVLDFDGNPKQEIPILLDAHSWYVCLSPDRAYVFALGLYHPDGRFIPLAQSNPIHLPPEEPSEDTGEEEWAVMEEQYEELMRMAGGMDAPSSLGGSRAAVPHVLRHRKRVPWQMPPLQEISASGMWSGRPYSGRPLSGRPMQKPSEE